MAEYWHVDDKCRLPNKKVDDFIDDLLDVYKKHNMSLGHEDTHGGFIINEDCECNREWVGCASVDIEEKTK